MRTAKRCLIICIALILAISSIAFAGNENRIITVFVDGKQIKFDVNPVLENGRTLVPMRFVFEALGATVDWDDATQTATAVKDDISIAITVNDPVMMINSRAVVLDVPAKLLNGRTLVPVRAVSEGFGAAVEWIYETSQVVINTSSADDILIYWSLLDSASSQSVANYSEMLMYQEMEKATGVKVEFIHPFYGSTGQEAFNTLLASMALPDMIEYDWSRYAGGADAAIDDGVIIALNDYLKDYAPNYYSYVAGEKNEESGNRYKGEAITDTGNYYGFKTLNIGNSVGINGLIVRADLIEKWGMSVPETIADWDALFAKARSEGFSKPFTYMGNPFNVDTVSHTFNTAYDVGKSFYIDDGKVVHALLQPGYKEFVAQLADWVAKGYIDEIFDVNSVMDTMDDMMQDNVSVACYGSIRSVMGNLLSDMAVKNSAYDLVACPYPVMKKGDVCKWQEVQSEMTSPDIAITTECSDIESAMKWCDYLYSEEGFILKTFGVEGDTYTIEDIAGEKHYVYTDKIKNPKNVGLSSVNAAIYKFMRPGFAPGINQHPDYIDMYYVHQRQKDACTTWNQNIEEARKHTLPTLIHTAEESAVIATLTQQYHSKTENEIKEIIVGQRSIDEFDTIAYEARVNYLGEILKLKNDAYKRYLNKLNY